MINKFANIYIFFGAKQDRVMRNLEMFNELLIHWFILLLAAFTDFVGDVNVQY